MYSRYRGFQSTAIWVLIGLNLLFFIVARLVPTAILSLGLMPAGILHRPWTILTSIFVHLSFGHILANMVTLYFFGRYLCMLIGQKKFIIVYFTGGILGSLFYIWLGPTYTIAIGASGAVFALGGALVAMIPKLRVFIFPIPVPLPLWGAVIGGFLILTFLPGIAWPAHLGGLIFGLVIGYFFRKRQQIYV